MSPSVTMIVVTYNSAATMRSCLNALAAQAYPQFEVVIVDNASVDGTTAIIRKDFPAFKLIENSTNRGFAAANNQVLREASGNYVGLVNPDVELHPNWIVETVACIEALPDVAIIGGKIFSPNQLMLQHAGGVIKPNALTSHLGQGEFDVGQYEQMRDVDYVTGAALLMRRDVAAALNYLDERFFMYFEETDLCWRARQLRYRVVYYPSAIATHHVSQSLSQTHNWLYLKRYHTSRLKFVYKNYSREDFLLQFVPAERKWISRDVSGMHRLIVLISYMNTLPALIGYLRRGPSSHNITPAG